MIDSVIAQGLNFTPDDQIGLQTINIPTFFSLDQIQNFSIFSYIALIVSLVFVVIALIWIFLAIQGAVKIINSQGNQDTIQEGAKIFGNVFWSITFLFGFFVVITIVASFFGLGTFWQWPKNLSTCTDGSFYFVKALELESLDTDQIDRYCFNGGSNVCDFQCPGGDSACLQRCLFNNGF